MFHFVFCIRGDVSFLIWMPFAAMFLLLLFQNLWIWKWVVFFILFLMNRQADKFMGAIIVPVFHDFFCYNFSAVFSKRLSAH